MQNDLYCRTCHSWLKARNDIDGHSKNDPCGIAAQLIKEWAQRKSISDNNELINRIAQRLSGLPTQEWEDWQGRPFQIKINNKSSSPESYKNEAVDVIKIMEEFFT